MSSPARVLVVDDSAMYRKLVRDLLNADPDVEVVGTASNGRIALQMVRQLKPDLLTLDIEMPEMDGLEVLRHLPTTSAKTGAIMLSSVSSANATVAALQRGAFDFVLKPNTRSPLDSLAKLKDMLLPRVHAYAHSRQIGRRRLQRPATRTSVPAPAAGSVPVSHPAERPVADPPRVVLIGSSTGGPAALAKVISKLPGDLGVPILIVQHMPPGFTKSLAEHLDSASPLHVHEAQGGEIARAGEVYIAPGGKQMSVAPAALGLKIEVCDAAPVKNCKPSVDYLFRSVAKVCKSRVLAAILTGMGDDGCTGSQLIKQVGGTVIAQDKDSCVVYGMPRAVAEAGLADAVCPLDTISSEIVQRVDQRAAACL